MTDSAGAITLRIEERNRQLRLAAPGGSAAGLPAGDR